MAIRPGPSAGARARVGEPQHTVTCTYMEFTKYLVGACIHYMYIYMQVNKCAKTVNI